MEVCKTRQPPFADCMCRVGVVQGDRQVPQSFRARRQHGSEKVLRVVFRRCIVDEVRELFPGEEDVVLTVTAVEPADSDMGQRRRSMCKRLDIPVISPTESVPFALAGYPENQTLEIRKGSTWESCEFLDGNIVQSKTGDVAADRFEQFREIARRAVHKAVVSCSSECFEVIYYGPEVFV